ncbi:MAG: Asp23/Gls24 family envelope stress response protein [Oscillospiraceae bacterium]|nr:Asp23/Gls24 family envelope stress response protein [Oscillospiraceae bacterium]
MADSKEYVSEQLENGAIHISEDVIASIAGIAAVEVEGVSGLNANIGADIAEILGRKNLGKGISITFQEDGGVVIDCYIIVKLGRSVLEIAKNVQDAIVSAVTSVTGLKVVNVNVTVSGVTFPKEKK